METLPQKILMQKGWGGGGKRAISAWCLKYQDAACKTELLMRELKGYSMKISGLSEVSWSGKDNKKTGTYTIWYNRREDGKHQQGVRIARESQTVKALIKIILLIRWYSLIYVPVKEEQTNITVQELCLPRSWNWIWPWEFQKFYPWCW